MSLNLDELEKVARAATPGPWVKDPEWILYDGMLRPSHNIHSEARRPDKRIICNVDIWKRDPPGTHENADFVATFDPPTVLALIARIRELEEGASYQVRPDDLAAWTCDKCGATPIDPKRLEACSQCGRPSLYTTLDCHALMHSERHPVTADLLRFCIDLLKAQSRPSTRPEGCDLQDWFDLRDRIEAAWLAGFLQGIKHHPWDDMHDWAALTSRDYAKTVLSVPPRSPPP